MTNAITTRIMRTAIFAILLAGSFSVKAQPGKGKNTAVNDLYSRAEEFLADEPKNYHQALPLYLQIDSIGPDNPEVKYKIGLCYLNSTGDKVKAISYLEAASKKKSEAGLPAEIDFYLGRAYLLANRIDEAIASYEAYKSTVKPESPQYAQTERQLAMCNTAKELIAHPVDVEITNVGNVINSSWPDYSPVISADESVMIFTSRREGSTGGLITETGEYFEDIYISYKVNDKWIPPTSIGSSINSNGHEATIGLSADGQQLFIYKDDNGDGNIYYCNLVGDTWSAPIKIGGLTNTKNWEPSACLTADGNVLYFVSDRKGGFGGRDIYKSQKLPTGQWGVPQNLGSTINTPYDDDGPFIHPDGKTLYFSSSGHKSMGGFDIFSVTFNDSTGAWNEPQNVGYPINSTDDDVFYVLSADGKHAYYSSIKEGGYGDKDIYQISFVSKKEVPLTVLKGVITLEEGSLQSINASIVVTDNETGDMVGIFKPNSKTGKYLLVLPQGRNYNIAIEANGYLFHSENLFVAEKTAYAEISKAVQLAPIKVGSSIVLKNIFFDTDKATLRSESKVELERLLRLMTENKTLQIEISGHTDSKGNDKYNEKLSQSRAQAVVDYLKKKGVDGKRMVAKGYGESKPIASNDTEEGRQENRRTEFKITSY